MQMNAQADATTLIQGWLRWRTQQAGDQHRPSASITDKPLNDAQIFGATQKP